MKKVRLAVTVLAVLLLVSISANAQESITDVVQKVKPSVVTVVTYDRDGMVLTSMGVSAFCTITRSAARGTATKEGITTTLVKFWN